MKKGIIAGNFDVLHPGYISMFEEAKEVCDYLIIALHSDPSIERPSKLKPILSVDERVQILRSIKYIDEIIPYDLECDLEKVLSTTQPQIRMLGDDYKNRTDYTGYGSCPEVHYFSRDHGWSTTKYKNLIKKHT
jgi:glycerol-3-phosphate cytidylyltransferase